MTDSMIKRKKGKRRSITVCFHILEAEDLSKPRIVDLQQAEERRKEVSFIPRSKSSSNFLKNVRIMYRIMMQDS